MPELAEVEYYRKQWNYGLGQKVIEVRLHADKRVFRGIDARALARQLTGARYLASEARGKQMLFRFNRNSWLGIHLGMTGRLSVVPAGTEPGKHDHLALVQKKRTLVFTDMRQFGRVSFASGKSVPDWWAKLPQSLNSKKFTIESMRSFLQRHSRLPVKAALLLQSGFPGIGNWMADEILWRAKLHPRAAAGNLTGAQLVKLWTAIRFVTAEALRKIAKDFSDPPRSWLFHERWKKAGCCPIHHVALKKETIAGRTTAWCPKCQPTGRTMGR